MLERDLLINVLLFKFHFPQAIFAPNKVLLAVRYFVIAG